MADAYQSWSDEFEKNQQDTPSACFQALEKNSEVGLPLGFDWAPSTPRTEDSLTLSELRKWARLKIRLKHGRRMTRRERARFVIEAARKAGLKK